MNITSTAFKIGAGAAAGVAGLALGATLAVGPGPSGASGSTVAQPATFTQAGGAPTPGQTGTAGPGTAKPKGVGPHGRRRPPYGPAALLGRISDGQFTLRLGKSWVTAEIVNGTLTSASGSPTITVQPRDRQESPLTFGTDTKTKVFLRGKPGRVSDLDQGDHVRVVGIEQNGSFTALRIWCVRHATPPANPSTAGAKGSTA